MFDIKDFFSARHEFPEDLKVLCRPSMRLALVRGSRPIQGKSGHEYYYGIYFPGKGDYPQDDKGLVFDYSELVALAADLDKLIKAGEIAETCDEETYNAHVAERKITFRRPSKVI